MVRSSAEILEDIAPMAARARQAQARIEQVGAGGYEEETKREEREEWMDRCEAESAALDPSTPRLVILSNGETVEVRKDIKLLLMRK